MSREQRIQISTACMNIQYVTSAYLIQVYRFAMWAVTWCPCLLIFVSFSYCQWCECDRGEQTAWSNAVLSVLSGQAKTFVTEKNYPIEALALFGICTIPDRTGFSNYIESVQRPVLFCVQFGSSVEVRLRLRCSDLDLRGVQTSMENDGLWSESYRPVR